jgi:hypothetical protein
MNRMRTGRLVVAALAIACLTGGSCSNTDSDVVDTRAFRADFVASATGTGGTTVRATLEFSFDDVELKGGDLLTTTRTDPVTMVEDERVMVEDRALFGVSYERSFPGQAKDTLFRVAFDRTATGKASAPDSFATLPTPFVLHWVNDPVTMSPVPLDFSRSSASPRFVVWDPSSAPDFEPAEALQYAVTGSCIEPYVGTIDWRDGADALQLTGVLRDLPSPNAGLTCAIEVEIKLSRSGTVDPAFEGGTFVGEQVRVFNLLARP